MNEREEEIFGGSQAIDDIRINLIQLDIGVKGNVAGMIEREMMNKYEDERMVG